MKSRIVYRNGEKIGKFYQSNNNVFVKARNEKIKTELEKLIKPLKMLQAMIVNTPNFPMSVSDSKIITIRDEKWIFEIEHHLPVEMKVGDVIG